MTDFGLAQREGAELTVTLDGQVLGTPAYMSPEQAEGPDQGTPPSTQKRRGEEMLFAYGAA